MVDKGFINYFVFSSIQSQGSGRHWLCRAKGNLKWQVVCRLSAHDDRVQIPLNRSLRQQYLELPEFLSARAIRYQRRGFRPQVLLTSLLDPDTYPAREIVALYHERWELEIGFDEVKTHTLERRNPAQQIPAARAARTLRTRHRL